MRALLPSGRAAALLVLALLWPATAQHAPDTLSGGVVAHTVVKGESFRIIGSRYGVDPRTLAADNGIRLTDPLAVGRVLSVDHRHIVPRGLGAGEIVINVPQRMLFYRDDAGTAAFPVAVGSQGWRTPLDEFSIVIREVDPAWDVPASIRAEARRAGKDLPAVVPPGPSNPLGRYWLGLSIGGIGLHGTNAPASIYQAVTHGCVRLHPDDIESLFGRVSVGTRGRFSYEPFLLAVIDADIHIEAHRDVYGLVPGPLEALRAQAVEAGVAGRIDWDDADRIVRASDGVPRVVRQARPDR